MHKYDGYVYCITNTVNGKQYIGQTCMSVSKRYADHLRCANSDMDTASLLYRAMRKYGTANFCVECLESVSSDTKAGLKDLLNKREAFYIAGKNTYKPNGYNMTGGGYAFADHKVVPVAQVLSSGEVVAVYESLQSAEFAVSLPTGTIKRALNSRSHYADGYFWYRNEDGAHRVGSLIGEQHRGDVRSVSQFDLDGNLLQQFYSVAEAELETGVSHSKISAVCSGKRKSAGGFIWSYAQTVDPYVSIQKTHRCKAVAQMDLAGVVICTYRSAKDAAVSLNVCQTNITKCCRGQRKSAGGYQWRFIL